MNLPKAKANIKFTTRHEWADKVALLIFRGILQSTDLKHPIEDSIDFYEDSEGKLEPETPTYTLLLDLISYMVFIGYANNFPIATYPHGAAPIEKKRHQGKSKRLG
jgi:hypothetical protein